MKSLSLIKGLSWLILLNIIVKPVWILLIDREVQNRLGHEVYGSYFALFSLSLILLFIADAGLSNLMNRQLAIEPGLSSKPFLKIKFALSLVYVLIILLIAYVSGIREWEVLFYIIAIHLFTSFFLFFRSIITASQLFTADAWFSVVDKFILVILAGSFLYWPSVFGEINLLIFLQVQLCSSILAFLLSIIYLLNKKLLKQGSQANTWSLLKSAIPFAIVILLMGIHSRVDAFILERTHPSGALQSGIYAMGFRLLDAGNMIGFLAASFLVPFIARNQGNMVLIEKTVLGLRHLLIISSIFICSFIFIFPSWVAGTLYNTTDIFSSDVIRFTMAALPAYYLIHLYGSVLTASGRLRPLIIIMMIAVIINLGLNLLLIPDFGALGSSMAALFSQYFAAVSCFYIASRRLNLLIHYPSLGVYFIVLTILVLLFYLGKMAVMDVWLILALAGLIMIIFLFTQTGFIKKHFISR